MKESQMVRDIQGKTKTVRELLKGVKYAIDYYQREYKWEEKHIQELIDDLTGRFLEDYDPAHDRRKVADYAPYFLGSIIVSKKDGVNFLVDGQQRLTSLTLLLLLLRNLQDTNAVKVNVDELIASEQYGEQSFNIDVPERMPTMQALFSGLPPDVAGKSESVQNLYQRYQDIASLFPQEIGEQALPYFIDWLLQKVHLVEITAFSDDDAYTIFETMNDRGLSLSPADMLKGYLLANVSDAKRMALNTNWRDQIRAFSEVGKETDADFFKTWLRSQYATKIRERRKGAKAEDFDRIGTEFHRWLREKKDAIGLRKPAEVEQFLESNMAFYGRQYLRLLAASRTLIPGLEHVFYNAQQGFTLQYMVLLAPLCPDDSDGHINQKLRMVAQYIDIWVAKRLWNYRSISYSTVQYAMFLVMREVRGLATEPLAQKLYELLQSESETFSTNDRLQMHQRNRYALHQLLARLTDYVQTGAGEPSRYVEYVNGGNVKYEIEHVWANHPERHTDEFSHPADFAEHRNRVGGLLLLPKSFNASYGDMAYAKKLPHYNTQNNNLLARSLHPLAYEHNPGFNRFVSASGLPFEPLVEFTKDAIAQRGRLYQQIAERIWNPENLFNELNT